MRRLALLALVAACGKKAEAPNQGSVAPVIDAAPAGQTRLTFTHDGKTTPMTSAVAVRWQDDSIHVLVANHDVPCAQALASARVNVPRDDVAFSAGVSRRLAPDGTFTWQLTSYSYDLSPEMGELGPAQVSGEPVAGKTVEVSFAYKDVKGTIVAQVCGDRPIEPDHPAIAKAKHPSTATITVAGQTVPLVAAWRYQGETYFSSEPITCAYAGLPTRVTLIKDGDVWRLGGGWFANEHRDRGDGLTMTDGATGDSADGPTITLALGGATTIDGYKIELAGSIETLACVKR